MLRPACARQLGPRDKIRLPGIVPIPLTGACVEQRRRHGRHAAALRRCFCSLIWQEAEQPTKGSRVESLHLDRSSETCRFDELDRRSESSPGSKPKLTQDYPLNNAIFPAFSIHIHLQILTSMLQ